MKNIEWLQSIGAEKAIKFIDGFCPKHNDGHCEGCQHDGGGNFADIDFCGAYTKGVDDFGHWLFNEHTEENEDFK